MQYITDCIAFGLLDEKNLIDKNVLSTRKCKKQALKSCVETLGTLHLNLQW